MNSNRAFVFILFSLLGLVYSQETQLFEVLYGFHWADVAVISCLMVFGLWIGSILPKSWVNPVAIFIAFLTIAYFKDLLYWVFTFTDLVSQISYVLLIVVTTIIGNVIKRYTPYNSWPALGFLLGISLVIPMPDFSPYLFGISCVAAFFLLKEQQKALRVAILALAPLLLFLPNGEIPEVQKKYYDKVVYNYETPFQSIEVTTWKGQYWYYQNNINHFSSIDSWLFYEPMAHPGMQLSQHPKRVLIIGGENGNLVHELRHYPTLEEIQIIPLDTALLTIATAHPLFTMVNKKALQSDLLQLALSKDPFRYLNQRKGYFDLIFIDVPDPVDLEMNQYYTQEFYLLCHRALQENGIMVTQAGSPFFANKAFNTIHFTMKSAGFSTLKYHNQVLSLGEWGWIMGIKSSQPVDLKSKVLSLNLDTVHSKWINNEAMQLMVSFGKEPIMDSLQVNSIENPIVNQLYTKGSTQQKTF